MICYRLCCFVSAVLVLRVRVSCRLNAGVKLAVEIASIEDLSPLINVSKTDQVTVQVDMKKKISSGHNIIDVCRILKLRSLHLSPVRLCRLAVIFSTNQLPPPSGRPCPPTSFVASRYF